MKSSSIVKTSSIQLPQELLEHIAIVADSKTRREISAASRGLRTKVVDYERAVFAKEPEKLKRYTVHLSEGECKKFFDLRQEDFKMSQSSHMPAQRWMTLLEGCLCKKQWELAFNIVNTISVAARLQAIWKCFDIASDFDDSDITSMKTTAITRLNEQNYLEFQIVNSIRNQKYDHMQQVLEEVSDIGRRVQLTQYVITTVQELTTVMIDNIAQPLVQAALTGKSYRQALEAIQFMQPSDHRDGLLIQLSQACIDPNNGSKADYLCAKWTISKITNMDKRIRQYIMIIPKIPEGHIRDDICEIVAGKACQLRAFDQACAYIHYMRASARKDDLLISIVIQYIVCQQFNKAEWAVEQMQESDRKWQCQIEIAQELFDQGHPAKMQQIQAQNRHLRGHRRMSYIDVSQR